MFEIPVLYKNIIMLIIIILFLLFLSVNKNWNEFINKKKTIKYIIIFSLIYLIYYNFNITLLCLPIILIFFMKNNKFKSNLNQNSKFSFINNYLQEIYKDLFQDSNNDYDTDKNNIEKENNKILTIENNNELLNNINNYNNKNNINMNNINNNEKEKIENFNKYLNNNNNNNNNGNLEFLKNQLNINEEQNYINIDKNNIYDEDNNNKATNIQNLNNDNIIDNNNNGAKSLSVLELKELYDSIQNQIEEIDNKYVNLS